MHPLILSDGSAFVERSLAAADVPFLIQQGVSFPEHRFVGDYDSDGQSDVARKESTRRSAYLRDALLFDPEFEDGDYLVAGTYSVGRRRSDGRCFTAPGDEVAAERLLREIGSDTCDLLSVMCLMRVVKDGGTGIACAPDPFPVFTGLTIRLPKRSGRSALPDRPGPDVLDFLSWHVDIVDLEDVPAVNVLMDTFLNVFLKKVSDLNGIDPGTCRPPA